MEKKKSELTKKINYENLRIEVNEFQSHIFKLSDYKNLDSSDEFYHLYKNLMWITSHYHIIENNLRSLEISRKTERKLRQYIAKFFIVANSIEMFTKFLNKMASKLFEDYSENYLKEYDSFSNILIILARNTDIDLDFGIKICEEDDLLKLFYEILNNFREKVLDDASNSFYRESVEYIVGILYNTVIHESTHNIMKMREYNFLEIIKDLVDCDYKELNVLALLFTSYVVDENNVDMISGNQHLLRRIISVFEMSLVNESVHGFITEELAKGILQLSRNDENKLLLVNCEILDMLLQLLDNKSIKIQKTALLILCSLAFLDKDTKQKIKIKFLEKIENMRNNLPTFVDEETDIGEFLLHFNDIIDINPESENEIEEFRKTLDEVLWVLKDDEKFILNEVSTETAEDMIMISYCHKDQQIVRKIYDELKKREYKLWIDFNNMEDNIMDSMARGVEQSKTVIICESYSYQRSEYCRLEMTYAKEHKKRLVPLRVEKNFTPNGWLGIGLTGLLRVNMSGKYDFETSVSKLIDHLDRGKDWQNSSIDEHIVPVLVDLIQDNPNKVSELASWTDSDVTEWFEKIRVTIINLETKWNGTHLEYLRKSDWRTFVDFCKGDLGISKLCDIKIIHEELQKI